MLLNNPRRSCPREVLYNPLKVITLPATSASLRLPARSDQSVRQEERRISKPSDGAFRCGGRRRAAGLEQYRTDSCRQSGSHSLVGTHSRTRIIKRVPFLCSSASSHPSLRHTDVPSCDLLLVHSQVNTSFVCRRVLLRMHPHLHFSEAIGRSSHSRSIGDGPAALPLTRPANFLHYTWNILDGSEGGGVVSTVFLEVVLKCILGFMFSIFYNSLSLVGLVFGFGWWN